jgi:ribosomal protein S12 methylthiotransferase
MPIQHAADNVLKSMRRGITRRTTENLIGSIRSAVPGIALRTTLIVGYPNETEAGVEELVQFIKDVKFDRLGVFTYSQEDDTSRVRTGRSHPGNRKKSVEKSMSWKFSERSRWQKNESRIGTRTRAVIERIEEGNFVGRSEWDAPEIDNEIFLPAASRRACREIL